MEMNNKSNVNCVSIIIKLWRENTNIYFLLSSFSWLEEFQKARASYGHKVKPPRCLWKPAARGSLKLNVDASFLPNQTRGGVGGVLRNETGQVVAAFAGPILHAASPKQSELYAIRAGLDLVNTLQVQQVTIESDCMEAVAEATCEDHGLLANGGLIDDIKHAISSIPRVQLQFAPPLQKIIATATPVGVGILLPSLKIDYSLRQSYAVAKLATELLRRGNGVAKSSLFFFGERLQSQTFHTWRLRLQCRRMREQLRAQFSY